MKPGVDFAAVARLDLAEVVRSRWLAICLALYAGLAGIFVAAGLRESGVIGFTGLGRALFSLCHTLVLLLPLVALVATGQVVNRARDEGTLELLMSQPIRRDRYLFAILAVRFGALVLPLLAIFALLGVVGAAWSGAGAAAGIAARASALCAALLFAFTSIGLLISVRVRSPARANAYVILCWLAGVALVDFALIGAMLRWQLQPRAVLLLAALNPVQDARLGLLSAGGVDLETLGPVGFYLVQTLGPDGLLALGVAWPTILGAAAFALALRAFRRFDLV
jgi:ABC-type transport system involved in multi-copper enzyme maturation permease subunit